MSEKSSGGARRGAGRPKLPPELKIKTQALQLVRHGRRACVPAGAAC